MAEAHLDGPTSPTAGVSSADSPKVNGTPDPDAQAMVIASLKGQIQDLFTQVTQLNGKLVQSYDRVSDLEDNIHVTSANLRQSSLKISQLELERTQHLSALNTGLLVEKDQVTSELTRLMEKATDEAAQRGQAESARAAIEKELDDLSASLFAQANTMVAEARYEKFLSEQKVDSAETALKGAEEAVAMMQQQMQQMQSEKDQAEKEMLGMQSRMGKGKWVQNEDPVPGQLVRTTRLLSSHVPYQDFLLFVAHLRTLHQSSPQPPAMNTLLPLPFLARLLTEDSEPTIRLDLAPSLNWLSRRSVLAAIHNGQLTIEPMSSSALMLELSTSAPTIPGLITGASNISCALCGTAVFPGLENTANSSTNGRQLFSTAALSNAIFKRSGSIESPLPSPPLTKSHPASVAPALPPQVHIFRVTAPGSTTLPNVSIPSLPTTGSSFVSPYSSAYSNSSSTAASSSSSSSAIPNAPPSHPSNTLHRPTPSYPSQSQSSSSSTIYPLCTSGWCLGRLRATCSLWAFVRSGIVEKVWEEEVPRLFLPPPAHPAQQSNSTSLSPARSLGKPRSRSQTISQNQNPNPGFPGRSQSHEGGEKPPVPPRRKGLWGMASALGERAVSWSDLRSGTPTPTPSSNAKDAKEEKKLPVAPAQASLPPPPPLHPAVASTSPTTATDADSPTSNSTNQGPLPPPPVHPSVANTSPTTAANASSPTSKSNPTGDGVNGVVPPPFHPTIASATASAASPIARTSTPPPPPLPKRNEGRRPTAGMPESPSKPRDTREHRESKDLSLPASIPLPDSRPGTPQAQGQGVPSRTASPAPGAPPPLPRRAVARGPRPMSTVKPGTPTPAASESPATSTSAPEAPVPASENVQAPNANEATTNVGEDTEAGMKSTDTEAEKYSAASAPSADVHTGSSGSGFTEAKVDGAAPQAEATTSVPETTQSSELPAAAAAEVIPSSDSAETTVDPNSNADTNSNSNSNSDTTADMQTTPAAVTESPVPVSASTAYTASEGTGAGPSASAAENVVVSLNDDEASKEKPPVKVNGDTHASAFEVSAPDADKVEQTDDKEKKDEKQEAMVETAKKEDEQDKKEKDAEIYVGDATWEERTWKEVVRLKEVMFWAKIGAVRDV